MQNQAKTVHFEFRQYQLVSIEFEERVERTTKLKIEYTRRNNVFCANLLQDLPKFCNLEFLEVDWGPHLQLKQVHFLLQLLPSLAQLKFVKLSSYQNSMGNEGTHVVVEQRKIPFVSQFIWELDIGVVFHPGEVFESLEIGRSVIFVNKSSQICYRFVNGKSLKVLLADGVEKLKQNQIKSFSLRL